VKRSSFRCATFKIAHGRLRRPVATFKISACLIITRSVLSSKCLNIYYHKKPKYFLFSIAGMESKYFLYVWSLRNGTHLVAVELRITSISSTLSIQNCIENPSNYVHHFTVSSQESNGRSINWINGIELTTGNGSGNTEVNP
jgi:hypothetical protein